MKWKYLSKCGSIFICCKIYSLAIMSSSKRYSTIANNYPSYQEIKPVAMNGMRWLKTRRIDDNAESLWRLNDTLYDLTTFIEKHPGGSDWIRLTKGTYITEAFEIHHIYPERPEKLLEQYKVRNTAEPRNFKFTFKDDGFYRTFKRKVGEKLRTMDRSPERTSKFYIDGLIFATFLTAILSLQVDSTILMILCSLLLNYTMISAHNFFHQKDNFRMYYFNLCFLSYREWRIQHAMSHHLYPNSLHDLEVTLFEPYLCWTPTFPKNVLQRYFSWMYSLLVYATIFVFHYIQRMIYCVIERRNLFDKEDLIPFSLPVAMYFLGHAELLVVLKTWMLIILLSSLIFGFIGLNAGHHNTETIHDGDVLRSNMDWGIYCLDTVIDNSSISHNHLASLTHFGNHAMHHLLPTIDHGIINEFYSILFETMKDFETDFVEYPWFFHISGQLKQLARNKPSTDDPYVRMKKRIKNSVK